MLKLSGAEVTPGKHSIALSFEGKLQEKPQGLYLTRYQLPGGEQRMALVTQMEATDARRMFPCWDEPVFRSTFQLTAVVPAGHTGLSNMPEEKTTALPDGRREVVFGTSPAMSSYLVAFASAELEVIEDEVSGFLVPRGEGIYLGDAGAMIPPFTGNGMAMAFQSAELALPPLLAYARGTAGWTETCRATSRALRGHFRLRLASADAIHPFLLSPRRQRWFAALGRARLLPFGPLYATLH